MTVSNHPQEAALAAYEKLMSSEGFNDGTPPTYPDDFAGAWIGDDHKCYVLCVSGIKGGTGEGAKNEVEQKYEHLFKDDAAVILKSVPYSYHELSVLADKVAQAAGIDVISYGVDERNNQALVTVVQESDLLHLTEEQLLERFVNPADHHNAYPPLRIEKGERIIAFAD